MSGKKPNGGKERRFPANYGKATPQQVAATVLKYRPFHPTKKPLER